MYITCDTVSWPTDKIQQSHSQSEYTSCLTCSDFGPMRRVAGKSVRYGLLLITVSSDKDTVCSKKKKKNEQ